MRDFFTYLKLLIQSMSNIFSIGLLALFLLFLVAPQIEEPYSGPLQTTCLVLAFLFAGYECWKKERSKPELSIDCSPLRLSPSQFNGDGLLAKAGIIFELDICNISEKEPCYVELPTVQNFKSNAVLFSEKELPDAIFRSKESSKMKTFPFSLPPKERAVFTVNQKLNVSTQDPLEVAHKLRELKDYSLDIDLKYKFATLEKEIKRTLQGNYEELKKSAKNHWQKNQQTELFSIMQELETE